MRHTPGILELAHASKQATSKPGVRWSQMQVLNLESGFESRPGTLLYTLDDHCWWGIVNATWKLQTINLPDWYLFSCIVPSVKLLLSAKTECIIVITSNNVVCLPARQLWNGHIVVFGKLYLVFHFWPTSQRKQQIAFKFIKLSKIKTIRS